MTSLTYSRTRHAALSAVLHDHVRYHPGLSGPALGYSWSEHSGGQMFGEMRHVLSELWAAELIGIDDQRQFARRGHRVATTPHGRHVFSEWERAADRGTAA